METERYISGYCRILDGHRTVEVLISPAGTEADCLWPDCIHRGSCPLAAQMDAAMAEATETPGNI